MADLSINLIKNRHTLSEKDYQKELGYYQKTLIGFMVVLVISLVVVSWQFALSMKLKNVEASIGTLSSQLQSMADLGAKQIYLKSRLQLIASFLDERKIARQALQKVFSLNVPGVVVGGANFQGNDEMVVQFVASDVFALEKILELLSEDSDFYLQIVSNGVMRAKSGEYMLDVVMTLPVEVS